MTLISKETKRDFLTIKSLSFLALLAFFVAGCAHSPSSGISPISSAASTRTPLLLASSNTEGISLKSPERIETGESGRVEDREPLPARQEVGKADPITKNDHPGSSKSSSDKETVNKGEEKSEDQNKLKEEQEEEGAGEEKEITIADPLEPFNRAMFQFNDKLYFWVLKPAARGYNKVVPEPLRAGVRNFFSNLGFPARFLSSLLRADFKGAATHLGRFLINTVWGAGGFLDPSSSEQLKIPKQDADLGQTLGIYGIGQGFYIVWPFLGPYSIRDSINIAWNYFLDPVSYINPWYDWLAVRAYAEVNDTSLALGDYESLKEAAIDPYIALRDAYTQYRLKKIEAGRGKSEPPKPGGVK